MMKLLLCLATLLSGAAVIAQEINGRVTDEKKEALTGANILIKETGTGAIVDRSGGFRITGMQAGAYNVVVSFIGYETQVLQTVVAGAGNTTLNFSMKSASVQLSDVVIAASADRPINTLSQ